MSLTITFLYADGTPLGVGMLSELLSDGSLIARTTIGEGGNATFEVDPRDYNNLAVRIATDFKE
jgi:hypothetical protein